MIRLFICFFVITGTIFSSPWAQFRCDASHTGFSPDYAPSTSIFRWRFQTGGQIWSSPAISGDTLFIGSDDSTLYALNAWTSNPNGELFWSRKLTGMVRGSPAVAYGYVYVTCLGNPAYLYCLSASDGQIVWRYNIGAVNIFNSSPTVADSLVFVGSESGYLYCVMAVTSNPNGELVWKYNTGKWLHGSPAVAYGRVFIGTSGDDSTGGYYLYCLDEFPADSNGYLLWRYYIGNSIYGMGVSPAVADSLVFFSFDDLEPPYNSSLVALKVFPSPGDTLYWRYDGLDGMMSSPAVAYGRVYIGMEGNGAIERSFLVFSEHPPNPPVAKLIWRYYPIGVCRSSPAIASGMVYVGTEDNRFYCFNALSSVPEIVWTYLTDGGIFSSPAVSNGMVYVGSWDGYVYGFGIPGAGVYEKTSIGSYNRQSVEIEVYPNPFRNHLTIKFKIRNPKPETNPKSQILNKNVGQGVSLTIYDAVGRLVRQFNHLAIQPFNNIVWDGKDDSGNPLIPGVYFLILDEENNKTMKKIILLK